VTAFTSLIHVSRTVRAKNPRLADEILRNTLRLDASLRGGRTSVTNPGVRVFEDHVEEMVGVLKSLKQELDGALRDFVEDDDAKEFAKFFKDGFAEEEQLQSILDRTKSLGKVASTAGFKDFWKKMTKRGEPDDSASMSPSYQMDESVMDDFVEGTSEWADASHFIEQEFRENKEFFNGAHEVIRQIEKIRKHPVKDSIEALRDRIGVLIRQGQRLIQGLRKHLLEPAAKVTLEEDEGGAEKTPSGKSLSPAVLENTVEHYIDMLRESLGDEKKTTKFLKELFDQVSPMLETERGSLAAKAEARRRVLPVLVRFAHAVPSARPAILPIVRQALGR
jgi:hypothetical protein